VLQKIRWFLLLLGILLVVILAFQNNAPVELELLFFRGTYPLTLLLLATSAASFVFGSLMTFWMLRGKKKAETGKSAAVKKKAEGRKSAETSPPPHRKHPLR